MSSPSGRTRSVGDRSYRSDVDWRRLLNEGFRVHLPVGPVSDVTMLIASVDPRSDAIVLMTVVPHERTEKVKAQLMAYARLLTMFKGGT